jgi:hypothetical protein
MIYKVQKMSIDAFQKSDKRIRFALRRQDISCERLLYTRQESLKFAESLFKSSLSAHTKFCESLYLFTKSWLERGLAGKKG